MTKAYPSDLTWEQWLLIEDLFPEPLSGGRPRTVAIYAVVNAILYVLCQGCTWRGLPGDFPAWSTVYGYFRKWREDGTWLKIHDKLYQWVRVSAGREPSPSEVAVDSQSVETATMIYKEVGYDSGKKIQSPETTFIRGLAWTCFTSLGYICFYPRACWSQKSP